MHRKQLKALPFDTAEQSTIEKSGNTKSLNQQEIYNSQMKNRKRETMGYIWMDIRALYISNYAHIRIHIQIPISFL